MVVPVPAGAGQERPRFIRSLGCDRPTAVLLVDFEKHFCIKEVRDTRLLRRIPHTLKISQLLSKTSMSLDGSHKPKKSAFALRLTSRPPATSTHPENDAEVGWPVPTDALPWSDKLTLP